MPKKFNSKEEKAAYHRQYYEKNKAKLLERAKKYYEENKQAVLDYHKQHYQNNKEAYSKEGKNWKVNDKEYVRQYNKKYREENEEKLKEKGKQYRENNKDRILERVKAYTDNPDNRDKILENKRKYNKKPETKAAKKERLKTDVQFKLSLRGRARRVKVLKAQSATKLMSYEESLGCTVEFFKNYIESLFTEGMTWDNWGSGEGKWQLDEIKPCAAFDLSDPEQYKACFHYTNCQPLWAKDNASKGSLYEGVRHSHKSKKK